MFKFDLHNNEQVLAIYRQSEAVLFKPVLIIFLLIYFPWYFLIKYDLISGHTTLLILGTLVIFAYGLNKYVLWLLNVYLLTDQRLVRVNYRTVVSKQVLESPLYGILNVSFEVKGFWQSLFSFGSVKAQVNGLSEPLMLDNVSNPSEVKDFIWKAKEHYHPAPKAELVMETFKKSPAKPMIIKKIKKPVV